MSLITDRLDSLDAIEKEKQTAIDMATFKAQKHIADVEMERDSAIEKLKADSDIEIRRTIQDFERSCLAAVIRANTTIQDCLQKREEIPA